MGKMRRRPVNPFMVAIVLAVFTVFMTGVPSSSRAKVQRVNGLGRSVGKPSLGLALLGLAWYNCVI